MSAWRRLLRLLDVASLLLFALAVPAVLLGVLGLPFVLFMVLDTAVILLVVGAWRDLYRLAFAPPHLPVRGKLGLGEGVKSL